MTRIDSDPAQPNPGASWLVGRWTESVAAVVASMTSVRRSVSWQCLRSLPSEAGEYQWWEHRFSVFDGPAISVGASRESWTGFGRMILSALGVDDASESDIQATCRDALSQASSAMAQRMAAEAGTEVTGAEAVQVHSCPSDPCSMFEFTMDLGVTAMHGVVSVHSAVVGLTELRQARGDAQQEPAQSEPVTHEQDGGRDVQVRMRVVLGRAELPLRDIIKLNVGSVIELDRFYTELAEVMVHQHRIARGQVVVIAGNYGIKIMEWAQEVEN